MTVLSTGGDGSGSGASKVTSDVLNVAAQSMMMIKGLTGIDIADALRRDRKSLPDNGSSASAPVKAKDPANIG
jgi:hypothetical protein